MTDATTIVARATPAGQGGIAVVRLSGADSRRILKALFRPLSPAFAGFEPRKLHHGQILGSDGEVVDESLAVFMPGPHTFTGEDTAEIHCHGGIAVVDAILEACLAAGAVAARRGEFTRRAFLNGRMDLSQAEAVAELVAAPSREALRLCLRRLDGTLGARVNALRERLEGLRVQASLAVDFPDDEVECLPRDRFLAEVEGVREALALLLSGVERARHAQEGLRLVIAGSVNAGKSSLLNAVVGRNRALVTEVPGTTRDFIEEVVDLGGLCVRLVDTAGLRETADPVEALGIAASRQQVEGADALLLVVDGGALGSACASLPSCPDDTVRDLLESGLAMPMLLAWNKVDLARPAIFPPVWCRRGERPVPAVAVSATTGENLEGLVAAASRLLGESLPPEGDGVAPNLRQAGDLAAAARELESLSAAIVDGCPFDLLTVHLDLACLRLGDTVGLGTAQDVLDRVFASFCIGK